MPTNEGLISVQFFDSQPIFHCKSVKDKKACIIPCFLPASWYTLSVLDIYIVRYIFLYNYIARIERHFLYFERNECIMCKNNMISVIFLDFILKVFNKY
jgi:hypothetical protein